MGLLVAPSIAWGQTSLFGTFRDVPPTLEIIPRSEWAGNLVPTGPLPSEDVRFLLVHHTASGNEYQRNDVPILLRGFFEYHTSAEKGWHDIAYNFLIDRFGRVWEGREGSLDGPVAGDATGGNRGYTQLASLIGNFGTESPTPEALDSLVSVLALLADRYQVDTNPGASVSFVSRGSNRWPEGTELETPTIAGHRDLSLTECPGDVLYEYVARGLVNDVHAAGVTSTTQASVSSSTTAMIEDTTTTTPPDASTPTADILDSETSTSVPSAQAEVGSDRSDIPESLIGLGLTATVVGSILAAKRSRSARRGDADKRRQGE